MELLEKHFAVAFDSPNGIKELRSLILKLAMMGKLVPQDPNDQPASELLKEIEINRTSLLKKGYPNESEAITQLKKQKNQKLPSSLPELPKGWTWSTLMQCSLLVVDCHNKTAPYSENGIPLIRTSNIRNGKLNLESVKYVTNVTYEKWAARVNPKPGDILITREAPMGEVCIIPEGKKICMGQRIMLIRILPKVMDRVFLLYALLEPGMMDRVQDKPVGLTVQHLRVKGVETLLVPLPPLNEQERIVAKINELMARCDEMERLKKEQEEKRRKTNTAALYQLLQSPDTETFQNSFNFITRNFSHIYSVKENVEELKKAILQLAMMGKLVPQDPSDKSAGELLKETQAEKEKLIAEGKIKRQKPLPEIRPEEIPYDLPVGWVWCRLGEVGMINPKNDIPDEIESGFVPMPLIQSEFGQAHGFEPRVWKEIKKGYTHFADGDVGLAKITPCFENGKSCVFCDLPNSVGAGTTELHVFRNFSRSAFNPYFLLAYLKNPAFIENGKEKMTGSAGQKRVPRNYFSENPTPLPPLNEQKRIVAKINELMALCDGMIEKIDQSEKTQAKLLQSVLAKV